MCKPVLPVAKDIISHIFWKAKHISTVHHENGGNHLHRELIIMSNKDASDQGSPIEFSEPVSVHVLLQNYFDFAVALKSPGGFALVSYSLLNEPAEDNIPPPKA